MRDRRKPACHSEARETGLLMPSGQAWKRALHRPLSRIANRGPPGRSSSGTLPRGVGPAGSVGPAPISRLSPATGSVVTVHGAPISRLSRAPGGRPPACRKRWSRASASSSPSRKGLEDVARVSRGHKEREVITRIDGRESVEVAVYREGGTNTVTVVNEVKEGLGIAEAAQEGANGQGEGSWRHLRTLDLEGRKETRLTDGRSFAYKASDDREWELANEKLWVMDAGSREYPVVSDRFEGNIGDYFWAPDGGSLRFTGLQRTNANLFEVDVATKRVRQLTALEGVMSVSSFSADHSRYVYSFEDFDTPADPDDHRPHGARPASHGAGVGGGEPRAALSHGLDGDRRRGRLHRTDAADPARGLLAPRPGPVGCLASQRLATGARSDAELRVD